MAQIVIDMNEHEKFFLSEVGQTFLNEMAKSEDFEMIATIASYTHTSKDTLAYIVKRLTASEVAKYSDNNKAFDVVARVCQNSKADTNMLDEIYEFALKLIERYRPTTIPYDTAMNILKCLAIHPNTSEQTLCKLVESNNFFIKFVVKNPAISDKWLIELVEAASSQAERLAAVPELLRRLKVKQQE